MAQRTENGLQAPPTADAPAQWTTTDCPDCGAPAEVTAAGTLSSTSGPVEHVRVRCLFRHWFLVPAELVVLDSVPRTVSGT